MYNGYTAFAQGLRAKSPFPYSLLPSSSSSSDHDFLQNQNPYCNPNPNHRLPLSNGYFSRQSTLLYWSPSRTFLAAAATYLATTRRSQVNLSHCTASSGSTNCCVTVREIRCCHSQCFCYPTRSSFRDERSCNQGRGQKFLGREVTQARQVWRCNEDYECECERRDRQDLIERDVRRREKSHEPRSANTRIEEHYDYREFDNSRQRDDYFRDSNRGRRDDYEHDYEDNERIRLIDQRGRRDAHDNKFRFSDRRRREEYDDYEDNERIRLSDRRRRRDEYDDKIKFSDQRRRAEYDDYDEVEDVRNRHGRISSSDRMRREEHDFEEVDDSKSRRADQIKFTDRKRNDMHNKRDNEIRVSDHRRRDESYDIHREDKVRVSDRSRRDGYYDYDKEDKIRVSDRRRREDYNERDDSVRVSNQRKTEKKYDCAEEEKEMRREDQIRVSDRRGREAYDQRDDNIRVSDQRRRDEYFEYDNEDKIRVSDRRRRDDCYDYDNEDKIRVSDRRRRHLYYDIDCEDVIRVSDRRKRDEYYDYDHEDKNRISNRRRRNEYCDYDNEDKIIASDRRRRNEYYDYDNEDNIRVSDRRRRNEYYDYDNEDNVRVSDRRRRNEYYDYENEDNVRVSDQRRRDVYYDVDSKDEVRVSELRRKELYDARDDNLRVMDRRRRDEYCDYDKDDRIRVSDQRRREENYDCKEEGKIRVFDQRRREGLSKKNERINISDHRSREEADDYEEVYTNLQLRGNSTRVSGSKLERQSSFKERDEASTSQIGQTEEREGKYRLDREHYDRKSSKEGSQIVKIISEDDCSLVSRERKNAVNHLMASDAQLNMQNKTLVSRERKNAVNHLTASDAQLNMQNKTQVGTTSVQTNALNQLTVSEVETDVQNRTHVSTGINQVATSSAVQSQVQVTRDKKKIVNQLGVSETELNIQNRTNVDIQRKMVGTSSSVQSESQVARDKKNVQHQLMVTEVESDLQNKSKADDEGRRVDASVSVQNVVEFTKNGHNVVDQLMVSETESDVKKRSQIEDQRRRNDTSTSVQNLTQVVRDKHNMANRLTWSEVVSNVRNINQIEAERGRVDLDSSVDNVTQVASQRQKVVDQLTVSDLESDMQSRSQTEAEMTIVDTATTVQNVTEVVEEKSNVENQLFLHETEVNVLNKTDVNLTRVDASALTDNLSTVTDSGTSTALIQTTGNGSGRVEISSLEAGSHNATFLKGSLESASQLEKSSSYHVGQFVDSVHQELLGGSERKGPPDGVWDLQSSGSHGTYQSAASPSTKTENTVTGRHGRSLWAFVADIIKLGLLKGPGRQSKSGRRSSSSDSKGTDDWFSGQEELDLEMKNDNEIKDEQQLLVEHPSEVVPSVLISDPEVDLSVSDDGTVMPSLQEKTVVEVGGHESSSFIGETGNFSYSTTSGVNASGVVGATLRLGEKIVQEIPKIVRYVAEQNSQSGYGSDLSASITAGENNTSVVTGGSLLEAHISRVKDSGEKRESKSGKQLKRATQVPKSSFDEWEEEHSIEVETPAVDPTGVSEVLPSGVIPVVRTSFGAATLVLPPSRAPGHPSASASSDSSTLHMPTIGDTGIGAAGELKRTKQLMRIAQVQKISTDENEETKVGELTAAASDSTTFRTELLESGAVEGHEILNTGSRKHLRRLSQAPRESFEKWEEAYLREKEQRRLDEFYMREALVEAQRASDAWEVPVGAVLVRNGEVIARGCNLVEELRDSTAHAEMVCIREASNLLRSWRLSDTTLYVTLEPCAMCAGAILQARIDTVVWGAPNKLLGADGSWVRLFPGEAGTSSSLEPLEPQTGPVHPFHPKITIRRGILEDECSEIMQQFFKLRRKKKITKPETSTNPSRLPAHPIKFFSRFGGMFCM